jgi:hypothetical protein
MANKRLQQLFFAREVIPGNLVAGLYAIANAKVRVKDPKMTPSPEVYDREILYGSLSKLTPLIGKIDVDISFSVELSGTTIASGTPVWASLMEACAMRQCSIDSSTWSGSMGGSASGIAKVAKHNDIFQTAAAAKTIRIIHDTYEGQTTVYYETLTGGPTANADVFFPSGGSAGVGPTITLTAVTTGAGKAWYPNSRTIITATCASTSGAHSVNDVYKGATSGAIYQAASTTTAVANGTLVQFYIIDGNPTVGGEVINNLNQVGATTLSADALLELPALSMALGQDGRILTAKGCRGSVKLTGERGKPMFLEFTFKGAFVSAASGGSLGGVAFESPVPPRFQGIGFLLQSYVSGEPGYFNHATAHTPRILSCSFDMGTSANLQQDATQANGTGVVAFITGARNAQGSMKIDVRPEGAWPLITKLQQSQPFAIKMRINDSGNSGAANNNFLISSPGCKVTGASPTDTDNFLQDDVSFALGALNPDGSDGDQRELVISMQYSATANW